MGYKEYFTREEFVNIVEAYNKAEKERQRLEIENEKLKEDLKAETEQVQKWYQLETDKHFLALKYLNILEKIKEIAISYCDIMYDGCNDECIVKDILKLINESEEYNNG